MRAKLSSLFLILVACLAGCGEGASDLPDCSTIKQVVVTDIDETLTTLDAEFVQQILDPSYDPAMRAGGPELLRGYAERGFVIHYLTARAGTWVVGESTSCEQATIDWLKLHDFPWAEGRTWLTLPDDVVTGEDTIAYKTAAIEDRQAEGYTYVYAYGNAVTDIEAFVAAGIDLSRIFTVGDLAGEQGTQAIEGGNFVNHAAEQLPLVSAICTFK